MVSGLMREALAQGVLWVMPCTGGSGWDLLRVPGAVQRMLPWVALVSLSWGVVEQGTALPEGL